MVGLRPVFWSVVVTRMTDHPSLHVIRQRADIGRQLRHIAGFSMIEMLTVVAIVGVLTAVGFVAYTGFIESTKDKAAISEAISTGRALQTDHVALTNNLSVRSNFSNNFDQNTLCRNQVDRIVHDLNTVQGKKSPHDASYPLAFNGNRAWNSVTYLDNQTGMDYFAGCPITTSSGVISVPRGRMMVACVVSGASVNASNYRLYVCACEGEDICDTTNVGAACPGTYADNATCLSKWMDDNEDKCASPGFF